MFNSGQSAVTRFLRWSERFTKTDMVYVARGGFLSFFGQGVGLVASLILAVAVNHLVSKEAYGIYKFIISVVTILSLFSLTGISGAIFQSAALGFDGALRRGFWENIKWSIGVFLGGLVLALYYFLNANATLAIGVLIGASLSPFIASASLFGPFLGGKKDFYRQTIYGIIDNVVPIVIFIGVIFFTSNPVILVLTYFVTNALAALFFYGRTIEVYHADLHKHDDELVNYSKHLSAMGIFTGIANNIDQILLFHYVGATQLAVYNFAIAIPEQLKGPVKNVNAMLQARFASHSNREIAAHFHNKILWYGIASIGAALLYILFAPLIFTLLFPRYMEAVFYSQIYMLWMLGSAFEPAGVYLSAKRLTKELYVSNITYSLVQLATLFLGVIFWGLLGVVLARVITRVLSTCVNYVLYRFAMKRELTRNSVV